MIKIACPLCRGKDHKRFKVVNWLKIRYNKELKGK